MDEFVDGVMMTLFFVGVFAAIVLVVGILGKHHYQGTYCAPNNYCEYRSDYQPGTKCPDSVIDDKGDLRLKPNTCKVD